MKHSTARFTFGDAVRVKENAPEYLRSLHMASVIMVFHPQDRIGKYFDQFPPRMVYSIEYDDPDAGMADVHEDFLERSDA